MTQVRGRRTSLDSSTAITVAPPPVRVEPSAGPSGARRRVRAAAPPVRPEEHVLQRRALAGQLADPQSPLDEQAVDRLGRLTVEVNPQMGLVRATPPGSGRSAGTSAASDASGDSMRTTPVGASSASTRSWATRRPLAIIAARVQISSTSDRRWLERKTVVPSTDQVDEQRPQLVDALRVEAVGRFVEDEQAGLAERARPPGRAAGACPSSRRGRAGGRRRPARRARARRRGAGSRVERTPFLPAASKSVRFRRPDRCG